MGYCIAPDTITVDGLKVKFMEREEPSDDKDSGWRFYSGAETQTYIDTAHNLALYNVNTIANLDRAIIPYLNLPVGSQLERIDDTDFFRLTSD